MKLFLLTFGMIFFSLSYGQPILKIDSDSLNIGCLTVGAVKKDSIKIENIGDDTLIVDGTKGPGGGLVIFPPNKLLRIAPGEFDYIRFSYLANYTPKFTKSIYFRTNDPQAEENVILIHGETEEVNLFVNELDVLDTILLDTIILNDTLKYIDPKPFLVVTNEDNITFRQFFLNPTSDTLEIKSMGSSGWLGTVYPKIVLPNSYFHLSYFCLVTNRSEINTAVYVYFKVKGTDDKSANFVTIRLRGRIETKKD